MIITVDIDAHAKRINRQKQTYIYINLSFSNSFESFKYLRENLDIL